MWWHHWMNPAEKKQERSDGQTLEFNNNNTDCWNILTNKTNDNTISSFSDRAVIVTNRTTSLSLHTFCHCMMEMDGCILVILWTRLMHPALNHLLPVDMMCEILTKEWNSKFFCLSWRKRWSSVSGRRFYEKINTALVSVRDDEATTKSCLYGETTRHNTNNNFIFTLRPKHRTEPAMMAGTTDESAGGR